jgi:hypothetical protein
MAKSDDLEVNGVMRLDGTPAVLRAKLRGTIAARRDAMLAKAAKQGRASRYEYVTAAVLVVAALAAWLLVDDGVALVLGLLAIFVGILGYASKASAATSLRSADEKASHHRFVEAFLADAHPKARLVGHLDTRGLETGRCEKTSKSPHSGSVKKKWRLEDLRLKVLLADGSLLGLAGTRIGKTKSGWVARSENQIRGRWRPREGMRPDLRGIDRVRGLSYALAGSPARPEVLFWGTYASLEDLHAELAKLTTAAASQAVEKR